MALSACYCDPFLRQYIRGDQLKYLFEKTISFLRQVSTLKSALNVDRRLLERLYRKLFSESPSAAMRHNASFSSTTSWPTPGQPQPSPLEPAQGQGVMSEPMRPYPGHGSMMVPPRLPPPPGPPHGDAMGMVQGGPMAPGHVGAPPMGPQHQSNMMQQRM
ncbi:hypothetical protein IMZ48_12235 [Candidatus Bathyarchaeota archaeon]|nr:hypothetical protein [Candidatus Bathyarchaeota archaeon]